MPPFLILPAASAFADDPDFRFDPSLGAADCSSADAVAASALPATFFTGKPRVAGLGHTFLLRNYRADLSRWPTLDPIGYPDGWNGFAYCGNMSLCFVDLMGARMVRTHEIDLDQNLTEGGSMGGFDGTGIQIPYMSSVFNGASVSQSVVKEAEKMSLSIIEYVSNWLKSSAMGVFKKRVRSTVDNFLVNFLVDSFNNGYFDKSLLQDELDAAVRGYCRDGWEIESLVYMGATFDAEDRLVTTGFIFLTGATHHWKLTVVKE